MVNYTNRLLHGDCLELMQDIPDKSIDMILCDLPYGTTACKWDVIIPFEPLWKEYKRIIKDRGCIALFGSEPFSSYLRMSNIKQYKYDWVWVKNKASRFLDCKYKPQTKKENIMIYCFKTPCYENREKIKYYPQGITSNGRKKIRHRSASTSISGRGNYEGKEIQSFSNYPDDILYFSVETNTQHPTQKPVALLEYLIKTYTLENETVLDNCMGSGSTGVACINTNRNFIGIEKDETFFNIAKRRIEEAPKALFN